MGDVGNELVGLGGVAARREGLGQLKQALKDREKYLDLWPKSKDEEAVFLSIADLYEKMGTFGKALHQLEEYEKTYGKDPNKIAQLKALELEKMKTLRELLAKLKQTREEGASLLDRTMVFFSSNLGDASTHATRNMPVLLAGGGFKHGQHLAFDPKPGKNYPLPNLFVSMLQRLGLEIDRFASSTGTLRGLEMKG